MTNMYGKLLGDAYYWAAGSYAALCIEQGLRAIAVMPIQYWHWVRAINSCAHSSWKESRVTIQPERITCPICQEIYRTLLAQADTGRFDNTT